MNFRHTLKFTALIGSLIINSGCGLKVGGNYPLNDTFSVGTNINANLEDLHYDFNLDEDIQTTPVNPWDSGFLKGGTATDLTSANSPNVRVGAEGHLGIKSLKLRTGIDVRGSGENNPRQGIYRRVKQFSDTRPNSQASFVFSQLVPGTVYNPYIGAELDLFNFSKFKFMIDNQTQGFLSGLKIGIDYGIPHTNFMFHSGHDRWGEWSDVQRYKWKGKGKSITYYAGININAVERGITTQMAYSFYIRNEQYNPVFGGTKNKINSVSKGIEAKISIPLDKYPIK